MAKKDTKDKILKAACELFATKGFKNTTHQEIAKKAKANSALINYYFSSKDNLYVEAWGYSEKIAMDKYGNLMEWDVTAEEWMRRFLSNRTRIMFDCSPAGWFPKLIYQEMNENSEHTELLRDRFLKPKRNKLESVIRELLGEKVTELDVRATLISINSQYVTLSCTKSTKYYLFDKAEPTTEQVDDYVEHIQTIVKAIIAAKKAGSNNAE